MIWGYPYLRKPPCILYYGAKGTLEFRHVLGSAFSVEGTLPNGDVV